MAEPLGVAFIEIEPVAPAFRAKTEAQVRAQTAGVTAGIPPSPATRAATGQMQAFAAATNEVTAAQTRLATAEEEAATAATHLAAAQGRAAALEAELGAAATGNAAAQERLTAAHAAVAARLAVSEAAAHGLAAAQGELAAAEQAAAVAAERQAVALHGTVAEQAALAAAAARAAGAVGGLAEAEGAAAGAANLEAAAHERAAAATELHAGAAVHARTEILRESAALAGVRSAGLGLPAPILAASAAVFGLFKSLEASEALTESFHQIEVATKATDEQLKEARQTVFAVGRDLSIPKTSAIEAAQALNLLARSGFNLEDSMKALRGTLLLAGTSGDGLEASVREVDRLLDAFKLSAGDAEQAADAVAIGMRFTQGNAREFAQALATLGPIAQSSGLSLQDTNRFVLQLSESGLAAGAAAGSLRQALLRLSSGSKKVNDGLKAIGLSQKAIRDEQGNIRPDAFVIIADALKDLNTQQRLAALTGIFSIRSAQAVIKLTEQGAAGYEKFGEAARESGIAQEDASAKTRTFSGQLGELRRDLSDTSAEFGKLVEGPVTKFVTQVRLTVREAGKAASALISLTGAVGGFADKIEHAIPFMDKFVSGLKALSIVNIANPLNQVSLFGDVIDRIGGSDGAAKIKADASDIQAEIVKIVEAGKKTGGDLGLNETLVNLDAFIAKLRKGGPEAQKFASDVQAVRDRLAAGADKFKIFPDDVTKLFPSDLATGSTAREIGERNRKAFTGEFDPSKGFDSVNSFLSGVKDSFEANTPKVTAAATTAGANVARAFTEALAKAQEQVDVAVAGGSTQGELAALKSEAATLKRFRDAADERAKAIGAGNKGFATAVKQRREAQAQLASINERIQGIEDSQTAAAKANADKRQSDAQTAASKAEQLANKRDQDFLTRLRRRQARREEAVTNASDTPSALDNITAERGLGKFLDTSIRAVQDRIAQAKKARHNTDALVDELIALRADRRGVTRELRKLLNESKEERFQTATESAQLDLQILETRIGSDPTKAQAATLVTAHNKVIAALKKAQSLTKTRSVEWKRLQVDIEGELAAIRDLQNTQKKASEVDPRAFQKEAFAFLQTLHGFSTSLAGNLILGNQIQRTTTSTATASSPPPTSATVPPPTRSTAPTAKIGPSGFAQIPVPSSPLPGAQPAGPRGVTAGQGNVQITLLRQILAQVTKANQGDAHPESQGQRQRGAAVGDYQANL